MLLSGILLLVTSTVMTQAYLNNVTEEAVNRFAPGEVTVELTESTWDPEEGKEVVPNMVLDKDPVVRNTGSLDAYVFLTVSVPVREICVVDSVTHRKQEKQETEIVSFSANENWELLEESWEGDQKRYVYGYRNLLSPAEKTNPLFDQIRIVDYLEGELLSEDMVRIPVKAIAMQADGIKKEENLKKIYELYLKQENAGGNGA